MKTRFEKDFSLSENQLQTALEQGEINILGQIPQSSNVTLLVNITFEGEDTPAVYKPAKGERPLHDFPPGLYKREKAAYLVSKQLGWDLIPPTVIRQGPFGEGSVQAFIDADFEEHYFTLLEKKKNFQDLQRICALDFLLNNADRKAGHCLLSQAENIYGIDHGLSFHQQFKLRTVIWDFANSPIPEEIANSVKHFASQNLDAQTQELLTPLEKDALLTRAKAFALSANFPEDDTGGHRWPWPLI